MELCYLSCVYCILIAKSFFFNSRLKSQYENELREMERAERQTREKFTETRSKLAEYEGDIQNLHATIKQLEIQLNHSHKVFFFFFF